MSDFLSTSESGVLVVSGPYGIGKSRLVEAALADSDIRDPIMLRYTPCAEPFRTALDLVHSRAGGPDLDGMIGLLRSAVEGGAADTDLIIDRLGELIASRADLARPAVIIHEDVELSDPATFELCAEFLRRATLWPWSHLVIVDSSAAGRLSRHPTIELGGLDHPGVYALLQDTVEAPVATSVADQLAWACDGNPALLRSYARQLTPEQLGGAAPLPRRFAPPAEAVARTTGTIKDLDNSDFAVLAVFDDHHRVPSEVIDRLSDDPAVIVRLSRRGLIRADRDHWRLTEPLLASAAKARLSDDDRDRLHRRAEAAFAEIENEPAALYHRCLQRAQPPEVLDKLITLGAETHDRGDLEASARLLEVAGDHPRFGASAEFRALRARNLLEQGFARTAMAELEAGLRCYPDPRSEFWLRVTGLEAAFLAGEDDPGILLIDRIPRGYAEPAGEHTWLTLRTVQLLAMTGATKEARLALERAERQLGSTPELVGLYRVVEALLNTWEDPAAAELGVLRSSLSDAGWPVPASLVAGVADVLVAAGEPQVARQLVGRTLADPSRHTVLTDVHLTCALVSIDLWEGRYLVAERRIRELERSYPAAAELPMLAGAATRVRAALDLTYEPEQAAMLRSRQPGSPAVAPFDADLGYGHLVAGRYGAAVTCLDAALRTGHPLHQGLADVLADLVEALVALGRTRQAVEAVRRATRRDLDPGCARTVALLARCQALVAEPDRIEAAGDRALELCTDSVPELDRARTLIALGRVMLRTGSRATGLARLRDGRELMSYLGLPGWVRHADGLVQQPAQQSVPQRPGDLWRSVVRERDRSLLSGVAAGLTHDQLARNSYVSRRTVANRLKALYELAGVSSKSELTALVLRNPPPWIGDRPRRNA